MVVYPEELLSSLSTICLDSSKKQVKNQDKNKKRKHKVTSCNLMLSFLYPAKL